jgi:hypothetical protein
MIGWGKSRITKGGNRPQGKYESQMHCVFEKEIQSETDHILGGDKSSSAVSGMSSLG